jgi:hypothetical protein
MPNIAKLEPVDVRELWTHEERGFSAWLAENLEALGEALNLTLTNAVREKGVGRFSLDMLVEADGGVQVIIENQLEMTNHDHLGKVLTYLANLDAKIAIWIASDVRAEHATSIRWLNEFTPADVAFYLVKLSAFRINGSDPAPHFSLIAGPTEEGRRVGQEKKELAERHTLRLRFWEQLLARAKARGVTYHAQRAPSTDMWLGAGAGIRSGVSLVYLIWMTEEAGVELYIDTGDQIENKRVFDGLHSKKDAVEQSFGAPLIWDRMDNKAGARIRHLIYDGGLSDSQDRWPAIQDKMIDALDRLAKAVKLALGKPVA